MLSERRPNVGGNISEYGMPAGLTFVVIVMVTAQIP